MRQSTREAISGYLYLVPNFLGFALFTSLPVAFSLILSFCSWDLLTPPRFVGFGNFARLVGFTLRPGVALSTGIWAFVRFFLLVGFLIYTLVCFFRLWSCYGLARRQLLRRLGPMLLCVLIALPLSGVFVRRPSVWYVIALALPVVACAYYCGFVKRNEDAAAALLYRGIPLLAGLVLAWCISAVASETFVRCWSANDPDFWYFFYNTIYLMSGIPIGMFLSLMLALVMHQKLRGIIAYRTIFFLPNFTAGVAIMMLWKYLYNADYGLINMFIQAFTEFLDVIYNFLLGWAVPLNLRWAGPDWLGDPAWAKPAFIIMGLWSGVGGTNMILYLAALHNINPELYEAAEIDGANRVQMFRFITWPLISPTTFFITVMSVISGFQGGFMAAFIMTKGGPAGSTTTLSYYIFNNAFRFYRMGYAAAIAWVLFLCVFAVTLINWRYGGKLVHYE